MEKKNKENIENMDTKEKKMNKTVVNVDKKNTKEKGSKNNDKKNIIDVKNEENIHKDSIIKKNNKFNLKKILIFIIPIVFIIVLLILFKPVIYYKNANENFEKGNYETAIKLYKKLDDYKDSKDKLDDSYLEYARVLIKDGKCEEALKILDKVKHKEVSDYIEYAKALKSLDENNDVDKVIKTLEDMKDFEDANSKLLEAYYKKAESLLDDNNYTSAQSYYKKAIGYEDAEEKFNSCDFIMAEKKYQAGELDKAKELFKKMDADFEYNGIKVSDRLNKLNEYSKFVSLCGTWSGKNGRMVVRQTHDSTGLWDEWTSDYYDSFTVYVIINDDGTVTVKGSAEFYTYTNYSSLSSGLHSKTFTVPFSVTVKKTDNLPTVLVKDYPAVMSSSGTMGKATLEYNNKSINLKFSLKDKNYSQYFTYKYTSSITFKKS